MIWMIHELSNPVYNLDGSVWHLDELMRSNQTRWVANLSILASNHETHSKRLEDTQLYFERIQIGILSKSIEWLCIKNMTGKKPIQIK